MLKIKKALERIKIYFELFFHKKENKKIMYAIKNHELHVIDGNYFAEIHYQIIGSRVMRAIHADKLLEKNGLFSLFSLEDAKIIVTLGVATSLINVKSEKDRIDKLISYLSSIQKS